MTERVDPELAVKMATEIVVAFLITRSVEPAELPKLVREVRAALSQGGDVELVESRLALAKENDAPSGLIPAVSIEESITPEYLLSLEDGQRFRSLTRHLRTKYGMTPDDYRAKWGLPSDYPMVAPTYSATRSQVAKRIGLGGYHGKSKAAVVAATTPASPPKAQRGRGKSKAPAGHSK